MMSETQNQFSLTPAASITGARAKGEFPSLTAANELYTRLLGYCRQMYEEEKERTTRLNHAVTVYLGFTSFVVGYCVLKLVQLDEIAVLFNKQSPPIQMSYQQMTGVILFCVSCALFAVSSTLTILVLKVWRFERLCDPQQVVMKSVRMESDTQLLLDMIADFAVAANRNYQVNEKKAKLLSYGLLTLMSGFILLGASWFLVKLELIMRIIKL